MKDPKLSLTWRHGWVLFERTCVFAGIEFTKHFTELVLVETIQFFGSIWNVTLRRQTCGHHSSRVVGSKSRALAFYFPVRIWYVFSISKYKGQSDLGLCMTSVLAKRMWLRCASIRQILRPNTFLNCKLALCSRILFASTEIMHKPRSHSPLHFDIVNTYQIRTKYWNASALRSLTAILLEQWPKICRIKITFESLRLIDVAFITS